MLLILRSFKNKTLNRSLEHLTIYPTQFWIINNFEILKRNTYTYIFINHIYPAARQFSNQFYQIISLIMYIDFLFISYSIFLRKNNSDGRHEFTFIFPFKKDHFFKQSLNTDYSLKNNLVNRLVY